LGSSFFSVVSFLLSVVSFLSVLSFFSTAAATLDVLPASGDLLLALVGFPGADSFCCGAAGAGFGFSSDRAASYAVAVAAAPSAMDINGTLLSVELPAFDANVRRIAPSVPTSWTDLPDSAIPTDAAARRATARSMTLEPTRRPDDAFTSYAYRASQTPALSSVVTTKVQDWSFGFHISTDHLRASMK
jgi:hypothetical protein